MVEQKQDLLLDNQQTHEISEENVAQATALKEYVDKVLLMEFSMSDFSEISDSINSQDLFKQHYGVIGLKKLFSSEYKSIKAAIDANLIYRLIEFMQNGSLPLLQVESILTLTKFADKNYFFKEYTKEMPIIPPLVKLLETSSRDIQIPTLRAIMEFGSQRISESYHNLILKSGCFDSIITFLESATDTEIKKLSVSALSKLCYRIHKISPQLETVRGIILVLVRMMREEKDPKILADTTRGLAHLSKNRSAAIELATIPGAVSTLFEHLDNLSRGAYFIECGPGETAINKLLKNTFPKEIVTSCFKILRNLVLFAPEQNEFVLDYLHIAQFCSKLLYRDERKESEKAFKFLSPDDTYVKKKVLCVISELIATNLTDSQFDDLIRSLGSIPKLFSTITKAELQERNASQLVLLKLIQKATFEQILDFIDLGVFDILTDALTKSAKRTFFNCKFNLKTGRKAAKTIVTVLKNFHTILESGAKSSENPNENRFFNLFEHLNFAGLLEPVLESLDVGKDIVFANEIREQSAYIEALMAADVKFSAKLEELEKLKRTQNLITAAPKHFAFCTSKESYITVVGLKKKNRLIEFRVPQMDSRYNFIREIPNTDLLCSIYLEDESLRVKLFDLSQQNKASDIYCLEEIKGDKWCDFAPYNIKRNLLGVLPVEKSVSYHLLALEYHVSLSQEPVKLCRKCKWFPQLSTSYSMYESTLADLDFNAEGTRAAAMDRLGTVVISDIDSGAYHSHLKISEEKYGKDKNRCRWIWNGLHPRLFAKYDDVFLNILDVERNVPELKWSVLLDRKEHDDRVITHWIDVCPHNNNLLATAGSDGNVKIFDQRASKIVKQIEPDISKRFEAEQTEIYCVRWDPNGDKLIAASIDGVKLLDFNSGKEIYALERFYCRGCPNSVCFL